MILGAGTFQLPAITKAIELGCHVITVDYLPENPGHKLSHQSINCSTLDKEGVLAAAKELKIHGICTFSSDVAVPTVAYVCEQLGLPGASVITAETMATKNRFREFLHRAGLNCPAFVAADNYDDIKTALHGLRPPIIFKPVDTSGSRGVIRIDRIDEQDCHAAFIQAQNFSRSRTVCIEEFVSGVEVGGDAILLDGRVAFAAITHKHLKGFVVTGHNLPTNISTGDQERVIQEIESVCRVLDYRDGPLNFDAIVSPDRITLLEMSARNGGNGIPAVIQRATDVDVERAALLLALGQAPDLPAQSKIYRGAGSFVFGSQTGGTMTHICPADDLRRRVPEIFAVHYARKPGDHIEPFEHNGNLLGFALFDCRNAADYEHITEKISDSLDLAIAP